MHRKICCLCHNSALFPQIPSLPKLVLADLWGENKPKPNQQTRNRKKPLTCVCVFLLFSSA